MFPPALVPVVRALARRHGLAIPLTADDLEQLLVSTFFASLSLEEHEQHPLRIAVIDEDGPLSQQGSTGWQLIRFRSPVPCGTRQLLRLGRALRSERLFIAVASRPRLHIIGLARDMADVGARTLKLIATEPGALEAWIGRRRVLAYAQGRLADAPENVLLAAGKVRSRLHELANGLNVVEYVESVTALIRYVAAHSYGGILIISHDPLATPVTETSFLLEPGMSIGAVIEQLASVRDLDTSARKLLDETLRAELERVLAEIGRLSALDGATILDSRLSVLGFGIILPVVQQITVLEAVDAAATACVAFSLKPYGARHRAAASYASTHPGSLVFVASADGDMACMLRESDQAHVLMWRFRSGDLANV